MIEVIRRPAGVAVLSCSVTETNDTLIKVAKAINSDKVRVQIGDLDRLIRLQSYLDGYVEGQTWDSLSMEELAARFHWLMMNIPTENLDRFMTEHQRLKTAGELAGTPSPK